MSFKIGLVGLCTSHPYAWVPILRKMTEEGVVDVEVVCAWDSGETRPAGFAAEFCKKFDIPLAVDSLEEMIGKVDGVIVHTTNWDRHFEQAAPFIEADIPVLLDKPLVGSMPDVNKLLGLIAQGKRICGGSSLRFTHEAKDYMKIPAEERGEITTAYASAGTDDYNYGIHAYSLLCSVMGYGLDSVQFMCEHKQKNLLLRWKDGRTGILTVGPQNWLTTSVTVVTDKNVYFIEPDTSTFYRAMLETQLPYFTGMTDEPPVPAEYLLEPELAALAAKISWSNGGQKVFLSDLPHDFEGYDGAQFAAEYGRGRF
ncbi:MAG: Gfo/Idh/MocA family oxidoreductase [Lentisphaerae bacterium]|nr:Gfo/Idh/MocA family oxidoreductase [Lentisphaerota bacterium]MCP4101269.1 Gfo/Idh/MocA family oxidoreductase [Lentisphaerota bacterium]